MKWALVAVIVACNTLADILNTIGMRRHGRVQDFKPAAMGRLAGALIRNRFLLGRVAAAAVSFFALMALLSIAEVSFAVPATAANYLFETLLAKLVLKEDVRWKRWIGASLVGCGVALLALF